MSCLKQHSLHWQAQARCFQSVANAAGTCILLLCGHSGSIVEHAMKPILSHKAATSSSIRSSNVHWIILNWCCSPLAAKAKDFQCVLSASIIRRTQVKWNPRWAVICARMRNARILCQITLYVHVPKRNALVSLFWT